MKQALLAAVAGLVLLSAQSVRAADLGTRMPLKAPVAPVRALTWTGCYLGGHVGWGWGRKTFSDGDGLVDELTGDSSIRVDTDGFLGGIQGGCDYQFDPRWVIGVEGQFSWADISGSSTFPRTISIPGEVPIVFNISSNFHARTDWLASATARLGYALDPRWLLYVKGGVAWAHDKYDIAYTISGSINVVDTFTASETRTGWTVGGGVEWAIVDHWSTKLEYQFYDFGSRDLKFVDSTGGFDVENVKQQIHTIKLGINYRF